MRHACAARCFEEFAGMFDHAEAGFGGAPKFPRPSVFHFLTRYHHRTGDAEALAMTACDAPGDGCRGDL